MHRSLHRELNAMIYHLQAPHLQRTDMQMMLIYGGINESVRSPFHKINNYLGLGSVAKVSGTLRVFLGRFLPIFSSSGFLANPEDERKDSTREPPNANSRVVEDGFVLELSRSFEEEMAFRKSALNQFYFLGRKRARLEIRRRQCATSLLNEPARTKENSESFLINVTHLKRVNTPQEIPPHLVIPANRSWKALQIHISLQMVSNLADKIKETEGIGNISFGFGAFFVQRLKISLPSRDQDGDNESQSGSIKLRPAGELFVYLHPLNLILQVEKTTGEIVPDKRPQDHIPNNCRILHGPFSQPLKHYPLPEFARSVAQLNEHSAGGATKTELQQRIAALMNSTKMETANV